MIRRRSLFATIAVVLCLTIALYDVLVTKIIRDGYADGAYSYYLDKPSIEEHFNNSQIRLIITDGDNGKKLYNIEYGDTKMSGVLCGRPLYFHNGQTCITENGRNSIWIDLSTGSIKQFSSNCFNIPSITGVCNG